MSNLIDPHSGSLAAFAFHEALAYRKLALEADPKWFEMPENQRAYLDFCQACVYVWNGRQQQDSTLAAQLMAMAPHGQVA